MKSVRELVIDQIKAEKEAEETGKPVAQPDAQGRLPMNEARDDDENEKMSYVINLTVIADPSSFDIVSIEDMIREHIKDGMDVEKLVSIKVKEIA